MAKPAKSSRSSRTKATDQISETHVYSNHDNNVVCITDSRGYKTHRNLSPLEIRLHESDGFIPLWANGVVLRYRFRDRGFNQFFDDDADGGKERVLKLFNKAVNAWGDAAPIAFIYDEDTSDFEFVMIPSKDCDANGCVLASAFFPDPGRHEFRVYPSCFDQSEAEQIETFIHEIGHIYGLRHFFANVREQDWPSHLFGEDNPFSIMNYGAKSVLTDADRSDLQDLYNAVRSGELTEIDGVPFRLMQPYSSLASRRSSKHIGAKTTGVDSGNIPIQIIVGGHKLTIE
ncbi:matrixin family metalloprotease [Allorhodopirellula heiligendammensis]|uniref:Matrixin n=1 Tax=Allorhodopirellula heiligendammensis TaxID=2714739 RepID=A0A5C6BCR8_9BACT|nr:matrixin family metalloprotease [Allorhodopirellula heiligendammensis]TWU09730.1 Matrixin [Allorhodopirellula heiligendammensis]